MVDAREIGEEQSQGDPSLYHSCHKVNDLEIGRLLAFLSYFVDMQGLSGRF